LSEEDEALERAWRAYHYVHGGVMDRFSFQSLFRDFRKRYIERNLDPVLLENALDKIDLDLHLDYARDWLETQFAKMLRTEQMAEEGLVAAEEEAKSLLKTFRETSLKRFREIVGEIDPELLSPYNKKAEQLEKTTRELKLLRSEQQNLKERLHKKEIEADEYRTRLENLRAESDKARLEVVEEELAKPTTQLPLFAPPIPKAPPTEFRSVTRGPFRFVLLENGEIRVSSEGRFLTKEELQRRPELFKEAYELFAKDLETLLGIKAEEKPPPPKPREVPAPRLLPPTPEVCPIDGTALEQVAWVPILVRDPLTLRLTSEEEYLRAREGLPLPTTVQMRIDIPATMKVWMCKGEEPHYFERDERGALLQRTSEDMYRRILRERAKVERIALPPVARPVPYWVSAPPVTRREERAVLPNFWDWLREMKKMTMPMNQYIDLPESERKALLKEFEVWAKQVIEDAKRRGIL